MAQIQPQDLVIVNDSEQGELREGPKFRTILGKVVETAMRHILQDPLIEDDQQLQLKLLPLIELAAHVRNIYRTDAQKGDRLMKIIMDKVASEVLRSNITDNKQAAVFDSFYVFAGITPQNQGVEVCTLFKAYIQQNLKVGQQVHNLTFLVNRSCVLSQVMQEYDFMANVYAKMPSSDSAVRNLLQNLQSVREARSRANVAICNFHRATAAGQTLCDMQMLLSSSRCRTHGWEFVIIPEEASTTSSRDQPVASGPVLRAPTSSIGYDTVDVSLSESRAILTAPVFFLATDAGTSTEELHGTAQQFMSASTCKAFGAGPITISARSMFDVQKRPYYGVLRVKPALQPLLRRPEESSFYRLSSLNEEDERRHQVKRLGHEKRIRKRERDDDYTIRTITAVFSNSGEAWSYICANAPTRTTIISEGLYLMKADSGAWIMTIGTADFNLVKVTLPCNMAVLSWLTWSRMVVMPRGG